MRTTKGPSPGGLRTRDREVLISTPARRQSPTFQCQDELERGQARFGAVLRHGGREPGKDCGSLSIRRLFGDAEKAEFSRPGSDGFVEDQGLPG
jgi:hypothetical protein